MTIFAARDVTKADVVAICRKFKHNFRPLPKKQCTLGTGAGWGLRMDVEGVFFSWVYVNGGAMEAWADSADVIFPASSIFYLQWKEPRIPKKQPTKRLWTNDLKNRMRAILARHGITTQRMWNPAAEVKASLREWFGARAVGELRKIRDRHESDWSFDTSALPTTHDTTATVSVAADGDALLPLFDATLPLLDFI